MKKNKSVNGGILLEVLFMLGIMIAIFPFIQSDVKKRTDAIRNQMVVRDLIKLKTAVEEYLKRKPTFDKSGVHDIEFSQLYDSGLEPTFKEKNVLGQNYKVRVKVSEVGGNTSYDAIIIATSDGSIPTVRLRDIVKESKGYVGYVEANGSSLVAYSPSWQFTISNSSDAGWNGASGGIDKNSLIVKAGLSKKEYKYISRIPGVGTATMETHLLMNNQSISGVDSLHIAGTFSVPDFDFKGGENFVSKVGNITIAPNENTKDALVGPVLSSLEVSGSNMIVKEVLRFTAGLMMDTLKFIDDGLLSLYIKSDLIVSNKLKFNTDATCSFVDSADEDYTSVDVCNKIRAIKVIGKLAIPSEGVSVLYVANLFRLLSNPEGDTKNLAYMLRVNNLNVRSFDNEKSSSSETGVVSAVKALEFGKILVDGQPDFKVNETTVDLNDIIVSKVNSKLMARTSKIGGIDINEKTPLSTILRALWYEYADGFHLAKSNSLAENLEKAVFPNWITVESKRCEYEQCLGNNWYK